MKAGKLLLSLALIVFVAAGCNKGPSDSSSTYVPPTTPPVKQYGTVYVYNDRYYNYNININGVHTGTFTNGSYVIRQVEVGLCTVEAVQVSGIPPGAKPQIYKVQVAIVKDHQTIVNL